VQYSSKASVETPKASIRNAVVIFFRKERLAKPHASGLWTKYLS
jgi:hypothetical protein